MTSPRRCPLPFPTHCYTELDQEQVGLRPKDKEKGQSLTAGTKLDTRLPTLAFPISRPHQAKPSGRELQPQVD